jgi:hypothetical protein
MSKRTVYRASWWKDNGRAVYAVSEPGQKDYFIFADDGSYVRDICCGFTADQLSGAIEIPDPFAPKFPRYFVYSDAYMAKYRLKITTIFRVVSTNRAEWLNLKGEMTGNSNDSLSWFDSGTSIGDPNLRVYRELTEAEFKSMIQPPKPRYFVKAEGEWQISSHYRVEGDKVTLVYHDATEVGQWNNLKDLESQVKDGYLREVNPQSSDSLRRSQRYAEKYSEGKEAGRRQALDDLKSALRKLGVADAMSLLILGAKKKYDEKSGNASRFDDASVNEVAAV